MKVLKPLTSLKGNTIYVNYTRVNEKYVQIESACAGWEFPIVKFGVNRYEHPRFKTWTIKVTMKVENTMGFVTDHIRPLDFKPD
jgi:hypothetical protein